MKMKKTLIFLFFLLSPSSSYANTKVIAALEEGGKLIFIKNIIILKYKCLIIVTLIASNIWVAQQHRHQNRITVWSDSEKRSSRNATHLKIKRLVGNSVSLKIPKQNVYVKVRIRCGDLVL